MTLKGENVQVRLGFAPEAYADIRGASLVHADPPWSYRQATGIQGSAAASYGTITMPEIAAHLDAAYDSAGANCYFVCWCTMPMLADWFRASEGLRWRYLSAGAWIKTTGMGVGFHWRGDAEALLLYAKGAPKPAHKSLRNAAMSPRSKHSQKPVKWLRQIVAAFRQPGGGVVLDVYSGLSPLAHACRAEGAPYVGIECDPKRRDAALASLGIGEGQFFAAPSQAGGEQ